MAVVLYNFGALHTQLGAAASRSTEEEMKLACTHFQCAAWAFGYIRENYALATSGDLMPELLIFMQQICFAQAQECILEKSLIDNRKAVLVAKVTAQIIEYYNTAFAALLVGSDEGTHGETVGWKLYKEWKKYVQFKIQYMSCILLLYQGQHSEEQQKMGERVILYQTACERLEEARKESKGMDNIQQINEALSFVGDVVETKRKSAKNENEFIYHEEVPELNTIANIQGASLVKGIAFSVADAEFAAEDIFHRLVPIKAHETSSLYSEEKANILRRINHKVEKKDKELNKFMDSLNIDFLNGDVSTVKLPQPLIDRCADLNSKPNAIPDLISKMSALAEICVDVENSLAGIKELLCKEDLYEQDYQQTMGYRPSSHFVELNREFQKYHEAHNKAGESNDTLRKAMELHVNNLKTLSQPLSELQAAVPMCTADVNTANLQDTRHLLNKVNEMRLQRAQLLVNLSESIQKDDITAQLVAWGDKDVEKLFKTELGKHDQLVGIIEQNIVAQGNILKAFTDTYAKCGHVIKAVADAKHRREIFFSSLIASYDVYDDLLGKSLKGLEFYKKLQNNIHKLVHRVRAARDVHDEERQQRLESVNKKTLAAAMRQTPISQQVSSQELEALASKISEAEASLDHFHNASMRPTPIGQENTAVPSTCVTSGQHNNRATFGNPTNNKTEPSALQYPYAPAPQFSTSSTPSSYGTSHATSYHNTTATSMNMSTPSYMDNSALYSSQTMPMSSYSGATFSTGNSASGYLNPIYSNIQIPTQPQSHGYQNYGPSSQSMSPAITNQTTISQQPMNQQSINQQQYIQQPVASQSATYPNHDPVYYSQSSNISNQSQPLQSYSTASPVPMPSSMNNSGYYQGVTNTSQMPQDPNAYYNASVLQNRDTPSPQIYTQTSFPQVSQQDVSSTQPQNQYSQSQNVVPNSYSQLQSTNQYIQPDMTAPSQQHSYSIPQTNQVNTTPQAPFQYNQTNAVSSYGQGGYLPDQMNSGVLNQQSGYGTHAGYSQDYGQVNQNQYYTQNTVDYTQNGTNYGVGVAPASSLAGNYVQETGVTTNPGYTNPDVNYYAANQAYGTQPMAYTAPQQPATAANTNIVNQPIPGNHVSPQPTITPVPTAKPKSKIDLLSEFDSMSITVPTLQPIKTEIKTDKPDVNESASASAASSAISGSATSISNVVQTNVQEELKDVVSKQEIQIDSSLQGLDLSLTSSIDGHKTAVAETTEDIAHHPVSSAGYVEPSVNTTANAVTAPPSVNIENFIREVQRYEKVMNSLTTKTLNGTTPLETKWKDLHDLLVSILAPGDPFRFRRHA